jgi:hypothetical protein
MSGIAAKCHFNQQQRYRIGCGPIFLDFAPVSA